MDDLANWVAPPRPHRPVLAGRWVRLEPLQPETHAGALHRAFAGHDGLWDYMGYGPFASAADFEG